MIKVQSNAVCSMVKFEIHNIPKLINNLDFFYGCFDLLTTKIFKNASTVVVIQT